MFAAGAAASHYSGPFRREVPCDFRPLRDALNNAGYTVQVVGRLLEDRLRVGTLTDVQHALRRTAEPTRFNILVRLFLLARPVERAVVSQALAPMPIEPLASIGLLEESGATVRSVATLVPFTDLFVLCDHRSELTGLPMTTEHVVGPGLSSLKLASLTPRRRIRVALDVGSGSGYQSVLAAAHAERVIATDVSPRALAFTQMTAHLNGLDNIETRRGSLYEPVADRRFDLIVANPPFVISPEVISLFRDSGLENDAISEQAIRGLPDRLEEGGFGVVIFNWSHVEPGDWSQRPRSWITGRGCDAWLLRFDCDDPLDYTAAWLRPVEDVRSPRYAERLDRWMAYYERLGVKFISAGAMIVRRRAGRANWFYADDPDEWGSLDDCGEQVQSIFAARDQLHALADISELLGQAPVLNPEHELVHTQRLDHGQWATMSARLGRAYGLHFRGDIDRISGALIARCDGTRPLQDLVNDLCRETGTDFQTAAPIVCRMVATLLSTGLVSLSAAASCGTDAVRRAADPMANCAPHRAVP